MNKNFNHTLEGKVGFAVGTGRCGTTFITRVFDLEPQVSSVHERNVLNESFHRYCCWYELQVDHEGFLNTKEIEIQEDLDNNRFSFEASAQLSSSIKPLYNRFHAKFLFFVRSPERVVNSFIRKGVYSEPFICSDPNRALGYQPCNAFHHFLGRIAPRGENFVKWNRMTQVGKIAWYWNAVNEKILEQFDRVPESNWRIMKIEELTYSRYCEIAQFFGFEPKVGMKDFDVLAESYPNALPDVPTISSWSTTEIEEFEEQVSPMAKRIGYEYRIAHLPVSTPHQPNEDQQPYRPIRLFGKELNTERIINRLRRRFTRKK